MGLTVKLHFFRNVYAVYLSRGPLAHGLSPGQWRRREHGQDDGSVPLHQNQAAQLVAEGARNRPPFGIGLKGARGGEFGALACIIRGLCGGRGRGSFVDVGRALRGVTDVISNSVFRSIPISGVRCEAILKNATHSLFSKRGGRALLYSFSFSDSGGGALGCRIGSDWVYRNLWRRAVLQECGQHHGD